MKLLVENKTFGRGADIININHIESLFINHKEEIEIIRMGYEDNFIISKNYHSFPRRVSIFSLYFKLLRLIEHQEINITLNLEECEEWTTIVNQIERG